MRIQPISTNYYVSKSQRKITPNNQTRQTTFKGLIAHEKTNFLSMGITACIAVAALSFVDGFVKKEKHEELKELLAPNFANPDSTKEARLNDAIKYYDYLMSTYNQEDEIKTILQKYTSQQSEEAENITENEKLEISEILNPQQDKTIDTKSS